jgi:hypothetical protein
MYTYAGFGKRSRRMQPNQAASSLCAAGVTGLKAEASSLAKVLEPSQGFSVERKKEALKVSTE